LGGFSSAKAELESNNISFVAASSDGQDKAVEMAAELGIPIGFGLDQAFSESVGGYWEANRKFAQPSEFVLSPENVIVQVSYSDGPLARTEAEDVLKLVAFREKQRQAG
jgi:peroxiredoxin